MTIQNVVVDAWIYGCLIYVGVTVWRDDADRRRDRADLERLERNTRPINAIRREPRNDPSPRRRAS